MLGLLSSRRKGGREGVQEGKIGGERREREKEGERKWIKWKRKGKETVYVIRGDRIAVGVVSCLD